MGKLPGKEKRCPLDVKVEEEVDCGTYVRRLITYASEPGCRVPAYLLIPKDVLDGQAEGAGRPVPARHRQRRRPRHRRRPRQAGRTAATPANWPSAATSRLAPNYPLLAKYQPDLKKLGWESGTLKAVWDNIRGLDLLESLPFVDAEGVRRDRPLARRAQLGLHRRLRRPAQGRRVELRAGLVPRLLRRRREELACRRRAGARRATCRKLADYQGRLADIPFDFHELIGALAPRHVLIVAPKKDPNFRADSVDRIAAAARPVFKLYGHADRLRVEHPDCGHDFLRHARGCLPAVRQGTERESLRPGIISSRSARRPLPNTTITRRFGRRFIARAFRVSGEFFSITSCIPDECRYHFFWNNPTLRISGTPIRFHSIPRTLCPGVIMKPPF